MDETGPVLADDISGKIGNKLPKRKKKNTFWMMNCFMAKYEAITVPMKSSMGKSGKSLSLCNIWLLQRGDDRKIR
jgi:hypothetical protein